MGDRVSPSKGNTKHHQESRSHGPDSEFQRTRERRQRFDDMKEIEALEEIREIIAEFNLNSKVAAAPTPPQAASEPIQVSDVSVPLSDAVISVPQ